MRITDELRPWRCTGHRKDGRLCNSLLMRLNLREGRIEVKCGDCNTVYIKESSNPSENLTQVNSVQPV